MWAFGSPQSGHGVDTTDTFDAGVASLEAHRAYIDGLGWEHFDAREFLEGMAAPTGQRMGVGFAAAFEVFPMGWGDRAAIGTVRLHRTSHRAGARTGRPDTSWGESAAPGPEPRETQT